MLSTPSLRIPNDCLIVALQAAARLVDVVPWVAVMDIDYGRPKLSHAVCVFELPDGARYVYDANGSQKIQAKSRTAKQMGLAVCRAWKWTCYRAEYLTQSLPK